MSYHFCDVDDGKDRRVLQLVKNSLQRQLLITQSEIQAEAERLGLTYDELIRLVKEAA